MTLSLNLKEYTSAAHQQLEKELIKRLKSKALESDYLAILQVFYGFVHALETEIFKYVDESVLPDFSERRKSDWLVNDICSVGGNQKDIPQATDLPLIQNKFQAFGALYVMEGSTLGGEIISKMLVGKLGDQGAKGLTFFKSYGEETAGMWKRFKDVLDGISINQDTEKQVLVSADQTFLKFKHWIEKND